MIKKIAVSICLLFSSVIIAQENNSSPYSYYGIGDTKFKGTVENRSMGGLGILADSIHINLQNPASYSALQLTTYTIGASNNSTSFKTSSSKDNANTTTLDYLAVGIPIDKFGVVFGLMPYTSVGYKIKNTVTGIDGFSRNREFNGEGGLNRAFFGAAYQITSRFSLGADFQYNFGNIDTKSIVGMPDLVIQYPTRELNESRYNGFSFNLGAMYNAKISDKLDLYSSVTYTPQSELKSITQRKTSTINYVGNREVVVDVIEEASVKENIKLPSKVSFGSGIGEKRKWFAGAEYVYQESNELGNRFNTVTTAAFEASHKFIVGGYYIPNYNSFTSYLSRVTYRAGMRYENTGLIVNNQSIKDYALSLGAGLPIGGYTSFSNLNFGLELGQRGTKKSNLVQENYVNIFVSLSINDKWFIKRKYD